MIWSNYPSAKNKHIFCIRNLCCWGLVSHGLTRHTVHHNQGSVSDTEGSSHLRGEVNVPGWVNQVDQEAIPVLGLLNEGQVIITELVEQGDGAASWNNLLERVCKTPHKKMQYVTIEEYDPNTIFYAEVFHTMPHNIALAKSNEFTSTRMNFTSASLPIVFYTMTVKSQSRTVVKVVFITNGVLCKNV